MKAKPRPNVFSNTHPADCVRQKVQCHVLRTAGWLTPTNDIDSSFSERATDVFDHLPDATLADDPQEWTLGQFKFDPLIKQTGLGGEKAIACIVRAFFRRIHEIEEAAIENAKDYHDRSSEFWQLGNEVLKALEEHAVVPSTIVTTRRVADVDSPNPLSDKHNPTYTYYPRPSTVLNCARLVIESGTDELVQTCFPTKKPPFCAEDIARSRYLLNEWTRKAIGDNNLLRKFQHGN